LLTPAVFTTKPDDAHLLDADIRGMWVLSGFEIQGAECSVKPALAAPWVLHLRLESAHFCLLGCALQRSAVDVIGRLGFAYSYSGFSLLFLCNLEGFHRDCPGRLHACEGPITATGGHRQRRSSQSDNYEESFHGFHLDILK
jgi:hypothetical protein